MKPMKFVLNYLWIATLLMASSGARAAAGSPLSSENITVQGALVCLDSSSKEITCKAEDEALGLKTEAGQIFALEKHDNVRALHVEKRLKTREFRLTLRKKEDSTVYELVKAQFIRNGQLHDFYYFCEVCNITTHAPGPCMCCRQEPEYREQAVH
jgi:hypothetical protein